MLLQLIPEDARSSVVETEMHYRIDNLRHNHPDVDYSHGICPECRKEIY